MWSAAASAILGGMPEAADLRVLRSDGQTWVFAGKTVLFRFADGDSGLRNIAVAALRQIGFSGKQVAAALGLTENYVATLHQRAQREGTAGLVRPRGRPQALEPSRWEQARAWRAAGMRDAEIARPARRAAVHGAAAARPRCKASWRWRTAPRSLPRLRRRAGRTSRRSPDQRPRRGETNRNLSRQGSCRSRGSCRRGATAEQVKHLAPAEAGPLAGLAALPSLRTLRPRLAAIADAADPLELQAAFAQAMLAANPETSGVYYVDDHFVPYADAKPVGKGWNNKRGRAEKGHADTHVTTHDGRAVCFVTGEPSGLSVTLPKALAELKKTVPEGTEIMLGFDRGGAYPAVFAHCRDNNVHWVTYRRAPLAAPGMLPVLSVITVNGKTRAVAWTDEEVQLKDYGAARQLTLFEHGRPVLQILTSDFEACPAALLGWLKSRWREENFLKYASENYGIDAICDYAADIEANTKIVDNPARKKANAAVREGRKDPGRRRTRPGRPARRPGHRARGQERQADPRRRARDRRRPPPA
jgi:hypothetical protein